MIQALESKASKVSQEHTQSLKLVSESNLSLDKSNLTAHEALKKDFHSKHEKLIADKQALADAHNVALKQRIDDLAARDAKYTADLNQ